jgi:hypothetical protein
MLERRQFLAALVAVPLLTRFSPPILADYSVCNPRIVRSLNELAWEETVQLLDTGEVPGVIRAVGWTPLTLDFVPGSFSVVNILDDEIGRVERLLPVADEDAKW